MKLTCRSREVRTVFDLLGDKENDMTFSLGWVMGVSHHFVKAFLRYVTEAEWAKTVDAIIQLQTGRIEYGITDVEIKLDSALAMTIEAKRGPELPSLDQLRRYANAM